MSEPLNNPPPSKSQDSKGPFAYLNPYYFLDAAAEVVGRKVKEVKAQLDSFTVNMQASLTEKPSSPKKAMATRLMNKKTLPNATRQIRKAPSPRIVQRNDFLSLGALLAATVVDPFKRLFYFSTEANNSSPSLAKKTRPIRASNPKRKIEERVNFSSGSLACLPNSWRSSQRRKQPPSSSLVASSSHGTRKETSPRKGPEITQNFVGERGNKLSRNDLAPKGNIPTKKENSPQQTPSPPILSQALIPSVGSAPKSTSPPKRAQYLETPFLTSNGPSFSGKIVFEQEPAATTALLSALSQLHPALKNSVPPLALEKFPSLVEADLASLEPPSTVLSPIPSTERLVILEGGESQKVLADGKIHYYLNKENRINGSGTTLNFKPQEGDLALLLPEGTSQGNLPGVIPAFYAAKGFVSSSSQDLLDTFPFMDRQSRERAKDLVLGLYAVGNIGGQQQLGSQTGNGHHKPYSDTGIPIDEPDEMNKVAMLDDSEMAAPSRGRERSFDTVVIS